MPSALSTFAAFFASAALTELRMELAGTAIGVILLTSGIVAFGAYFIYGRAKDLTLVYFALFCLAYSVRLLLRQASVREAIELSPVLFGHLNWALVVIVPIPFTLFLLQVSPKKLQIFLRAALALEIAFAVFAVFEDLHRVSRDTLGYANSALVIFFFIVMVVYVLYQLVSRRMNTESRVLAFGFIVLSGFILYTNLRGLGVVQGPDVEPIGFLLMFGCLGFVTVRRMLDNEENLLAIRKELDIARQIQNSILPQTLPRVAGLNIAARYLPMSDVAGDFYDFHHVSPKAVGILVADVSGHGVPAALIASMLKVAFAGQAGIASDPARVLSGLNEALCGKFEEHFVTAAYLFVDLAAKTIRYAGAGHPPILIANGAHRAEAVEHNGVLLGLVPGAQYTTMEIPAAPGTRCVLYTDGVVEARNSAQVEFGKERALDELQNMASVPVGEFADRLIADVQKWSNPSNGAGRARQDDDLTLVVIEVEAPR